MKITIAGANSFIGKRFLTLVEKQDDVEIIAVIRKGSSYYDVMKKYSKVIKIVECNMEDYDRLGILAGAGDCFIDLPWKGSRGSDRQNYEMQKENYLCNIAAMKSMADAGYKILVSAGSQAEYGLCSNVITEDTPLNPNTEYGKFKVQLFHETTEICDKYGIRFIEPRYFSLYGPGDYEKTLIMSCICKMLKNIDCELNECMQLWDYLYVDDAMDALLKLCTSTKASGAYNFAAGEHRFIREFVMDIHKTLGSKSQVHFGSSKSNFNGQIINLIPSIKKLKQDIDWKPTTTFAEGIRITAQCFK